MSSLKNTSDETCKSSASLRASKDKNLLIWREILKRVHLRDILNCRLVSKELKFIADSFGEHDEVIVSKFSSCLLKRRWYFTNNIMDRQDVVTTQSFDRTDSVINQRLLGHSLRRIFFCNALVSLSTLNALERLNSIEFYRTKVRDTIKYHSTLKLSMLKNLVIDSEINTFTESGRCIMFETPKLKKLKSLSQFNSVFVFPESIVHLESHHLDASTQSWISFTKMVNLEHIYTRTIRISDVDKFIETYPKLKTLHFHQLPACFRTPPKSKENIRNSGVQVYFCNFELDTFPEKLKSKASTQSVGASRLQGKYLFRLYAENYTRVADYCPGYEILNYNDLENGFHPQKIPDDFIARLPNLNTIGALGVARDIEQFVKVLKACKCLIKLVVNSAFGQTFFEELPNIVPDLCSLEITGTQYWIDPSCIFKFKEIRSFDVKQQLDFEFVGKFINTFIGSRFPVKELHFYYHNCMIGILFGYEYEMSLINLEIGPIRKTKNSQIEKRCLKNIDDLIESIKSITGELSKLDREKNSLL